MEEKEHCENCRKEITKEMKGSQCVIYASAEHTLSDGNMDFCDPMFGGVYCCQDCYNEQSGIKLAYEEGRKEATLQAKKEELAFLDDIRNLLKSKSKGKISEYSAIIQEENNNIKIRYDLLIDLQEKIQKRISKLKKEIKNGT